MATRNVVWTKTADIQFVGILEYWAKRNKSTSYSKKLIKIVSEKTRQIAKFPYSGKKTNYKDIRVTTLKNYNIYFRFSDDQIIIYAFWDTRQDPKKLLKILSK